MADLAFVGLTIVFFAASLGYAKACEHLFETRA
jgi:hypothetical protein